MRKENTMKFRPCIDLHQGVVKQIVGSTLTDGNEGPATNFTAEKPASWFAELYRKDNLTGGHVIQLGGGNEAAATDALAAWPGGLQIGGGIDQDNCTLWLDRGSSAVIVTSWVFHDGRIDKDRLTKLSRTVGKDRLVLDLSCRKRGEDYIIVTNRWQTFTEEKVDFALLDDLSAYCHEFLIHAVDVEGMCRGIELPLVELLGRWAGIPITYAGGIRSMEDIDTIGRLGGGAIDYTVGSALDIFGGKFLRYGDLVKRG
jgi:phosphoribosylformimino-5-aminoimidazole carboxamide ribotide isomerase